MIGHVAVRSGKVDAVDIERGAERASCVTGRTRHEHAIESALAQDACIGATVERDAAAQTEIARLCFALKRSRQIDHRVLEDSLDARGGIRVVRALGCGEIQRLVREPWFSEGVDEKTGVRSLRFGVEIEVI